MRNICGILNRTLVLTILFTAIILSLMLPAGASGSTSVVQLYFAPQIMNVDEGTVIVDLSIRNVSAAVPMSMGDICGITASWNIDTSAFDIVAEENSSIKIITDDKTLIKAAGDITAKYNDGLVTFEYLDSTLKDGLIDRDGVLLRFVLKAKNPVKLWNSTDTYPIRFKEGSVGIVTYHMPSYSVGSYDGAEGIDGKVGGYNKPPSLKQPSVDKNLTFTIGKNEFEADGQTIQTDARPYMNDGEAMLPVRFLSDSINMSVEWDGENLTASSYTDYKTLKISLRTGKTYINAAERALSRQPVEIEGRIYIPASAVELLCPGASVEADGDTVMIHVP